MPVHDWSRVNAGIFHDFHSSWIIEIKRALNNGLLPEGYYALAEQIAGEIGPDVLALRTPVEPPSSAEPEDSSHGGLAVAVAPPKVRFTAATDWDPYVLKRKTLVIRHSTEDRVVALVEILSPGNKQSRQDVKAFLDKAISALKQGFHLLLIDLLPPGKRVPNGIHGAVWGELCDEAYTAPNDKPLTLAAYSAGLRVTAFIEPVAVGDSLPDMPLFLTRDSYIQVPLEATYEAAYGTVPARWRTVLETPRP